MLIPSHRSNGQIVLVAQFDATVPGAAGLLGKFVAAVTEASGWTTRR